MYLASGWKDYEILDAGGGDKLERWRDVQLLRPDPQAVWTMDARAADRADAIYLRSSTGGGHWEYRRQLPEQWTVGYRDLRFVVRPTGFKHTGLFPEQAVNWDRTMEMIRNADREIRVLNLFAYTGGATVAALKAGASVVHVDASKGMVTWAKENAVRTGVADRPVRWIVDDCIKFVQREIRRGNRYDIIIMDPPSYGRGPNGEVWTLEDKIYDLVQNCMKLLSDDPLMMLINSYTAGLAPSVMQYILGTGVTPQLGGTIECDEIGLPVTESGMVLPCGASAFWIS